MVLTEKQLLERNIYHCKVLDEATKAYAKLGNKILLECQLPTHTEFQLVFFNYLPSLEIETNFKPKLRPDTNWFSIKYETPKYETPYYSCQGCKIIDIYGPLRFLDND